MPKRPCSTPGCPEFATYRGKCQEHSRQRERTTNRQGRAIYSTKRWQITRKRKLFLNPLCEWVDPDEGPCLLVATDVHHKHGVENDAWDIAGLESLCHAHHARITRLQQVQSIYR